MEIRVHYSESLIRPVTRRVWARLIGWHGFAVSGLVASLASLFLYRVAVGDRSWYVGALGAVLVLALAGGVGSFAVYRQRALARLRRMAEPTAVLTFTDAGLASRSDAGGGDLPWRAVTHVWTFPEAWLLFFAKDGYLTIPTEFLTEPVRHFIRNKVHEHGGKVV